MTVTTTCGRLLQRLYGWSVPLSMISHRGESGARDMRPPVTNLQRRVGPPVYGWLKSWTTRVRSSL